MIQFKYQQYIYQNFLIEKQFKLNLQQTFLFSALAWLLVAAFGSLPFLLSPIPFSVSEAFFESMSGITTTGATIITNLDSTPKRILSDYDAEGKKSDCRKQSDFNPPAIYQ